MRAFLAALIVCVFVSPSFAKTSHHGSGVQRMASSVTMAWPNAETMGGRMAVDPLSATINHVTREIARTPGRIVIAVAEGASDIHAMVTAAAIAAGVPVNIAHAVVKMESGYNPRSVSSSGALGVMQVLPSTARAMGENPHTIDGNIRAGMKYLRLALNSSNDLCKAISGYNHGIAGRPYCTAYGRRVLANAR